jgi:bifunctional UDP-N-acetylglucosamine pyrophosphorylase/glucosamine-1-phosphate N-acetyltransferase
VLAAGLGTRMKSARAKVLHHLAGKPLIAYPLEALRRAGIDPVVMVVGYQADAVRAACAPYDVRFATQREQKGTGDAARAALPALRGFVGDVLLVHGDLPLLGAETFRRLIAAHQAAGAAVSLLTETVEVPADFGRIVRDEAGRVSEIVEYCDATEVERAIREINVGVYCADTGFLSRALQQLQPTNAQGELYLTDIIALARAEGACIADAPATAGEGAQISSRADLAAREKTLRDEINRTWMEAGVTLEDPATAYIGPDVVIGRDTIIGPNVILRGTTRIGEGCRLDGTALITDCIVADRVHIKLGVVMTEAMVADEVQIGPFAQLRAGTHLAARVHVGDFVETKNARIGADTKAMHLAYLGDTEIGEEANIGAGTITCNYDGFQKHRTVIGSRVQVGSDSQLVAPVTVGDDAYLATGTTVRKDVPPGALVFNPKPQLHREGWVKARRARAAAGGKKSNVRGPTSNVEEKTRKLRGAAVRRPAKKKAAVPKRAARSRRRATTEAKPRRRR